MKRILRIFMLLSILFILPSCNNNIENKEIEENIEVEKSANKDNIELENNEEKLIEILEVFTYGSDEDIKNLAEKYTDEEVLAIMESMSDEEKLRIIEELEIRHKERNVENQVEVLYPYLYWEIVNYTYGDQVFNDDGTIMNSYLYSDPNMNNIYDIIINDDNSVTYYYNYLLVEKMVKTRKSFLDEIMDITNNIEPGSRRDAGLSTSIEKININEYYNVIDVYIDYDLIFKDEQFQSTLDGLVFQSYALQLVEYGAENVENINVELNLYKSYNEEFVEQINLHNFFTDIVITKEMMDIYALDETADIESIFGYIQPLRVVENEDGTLTMTVSRAKRILMIQEYMMENASMYVNIENDDRLGVEDIMSFDDFETVFVFISEDGYEEKGEEISDTILYINLFYRILAGNETDVNIKFYNKDTEELLGEFSILGS